MEIICKHHDEILKVDEKQFVEEWQEYLKWWKCTFNVSDSIENIQKYFVDRYFAKLDDVYFYCDNAEEVKEQLINLLITTLDR